MAAFRIALAGCPNSGKTSLFNLLTGSFQRVANYAGVTVSLQTGRMKLPGHKGVEVIDLPGCYGLSGATEEQALARDLLLGKVAGQQLPNLIVCVLDVCQLQQQLPLVLALRQLEPPMIVCLNQADIARRQGISIDGEKLEQQLGLPCFWTVATRRSGIRELLKGIARWVPSAARKPSGRDAGVVKQALSGGQDVPATGAPIRSEQPSEAPRIQVMRADVSSSVAEIIGQVVRARGRESRLDRYLDAVLLHPLLGPVAMFGTLFLMFQVVFFGSVAFTDAIVNALNSLAAWLSTALPVGAATDLLILGVLPGVGSVLGFLPPILLLSLFLLILEGSGYITRIAFLCDTFLSRMGLGGHTVFPFLSGFACAIPAIMSARSIPDSRARMAVILALPLVPCSARLPVYVLVTAAVIPDVLVAGVGLRGLVLFVLYLVGLIVSLAVAATVSRYTGGNPATPLELPAYRVPALRNIVLGLWVRARHFLKRAGTIIVAVSIIIWLFAEVRIGAGGSGIDGTLLGLMGDLLHPLVAPLGFTREMAVALVPGLLAREVAVSALATVHAVSGGGEEALTLLLANTWSLATGLAFATWYIFAPQCVATMGVIRAETGSWRAVWIAVSYLFVFAWVAAFLVYRLALAIGG